MSAMVVAESLARGAAAGFRPQAIELAQDPLAELVAGPRERERGMGVQTLQAPGARRAADSAWQLGPKPALLLIAAGKARGELRILTCALGPTLHATAGLEAGDRSHEVRAGQIERGRERLAGRVGRPLLGDRRTAVGAADDDAPKRAGWPAELTCDDFLIVHAVRSYVARASTPRVP